MYKKLFTLLLMSNLLSTAVFSQDLSGALGIGVRRGVAQYQGNDFSSKKIRAWGNLVGESYLTNQFSLEWALNVGQIAGETGSNSFRSTLTGLSLLGRLALVSNENFRPYVAAGAEYLGVDPKNDDLLSQHDRRFWGVPFGGGVSFGVGENMALDFRGLYHHTFQDRLDGAELGRDDSFITGTVGLTRFYCANKDRDGDEVNLHKTNPLKADTDNGTVNDGAEVARGGNPNDASDDVPPKPEAVQVRETAKPALQVEVGKAIVLEGVVFTSGSAVISPQSEEILTKAFNTLNDNPEIEVGIQGHTDNRGSSALNKNLSQARAEAVKAWLVKKGVAANRIQTQGFGPDKPIASNDTAEGRQQNRRIEFIRLK
jgi:outer membrane protein OmpA-like peptidoglycan-associated protein/opacity protein-like surface antigen